MANRAHPPDGMNVRSRHAESSGVEDEIVLR
jgi:hypothetical protein